MTEVNITYYESDSGRAPFIEWLDCLKDKKGKYIILDRIERIRSGLYGDHKKLDQGVWEIKIHISPGYRLYFSKVRDTQIVFLCGGDKSTQNRDIAKAIEYANSIKEKENA